MAAYNFIQYHIFTEDDLDWLEDEHDIGKVDVPHMDPGAVDTDYDYAIHALAEDGGVLFYDDNIHSNIEEEMAAFRRALDYVGEDYTWTVKYIMQEEFENGYGVRR